MSLPNQSNATGLKLQPERFHSAFLEKVAAIMEAHYNDHRFSIQELALALPLSSSQLYRRIKKLTGYSPSIYLRSLRLQKSKQLLVNTDLTISEISHQIGFGDPAYYSRTFSAEYGVSPIKFRKMQ